MRLVRYLFYLYCVFDGFENNFYSRGNQLARFNTQFKVKESVKLEHE